MLDNFVEMSIVDLDKQGHISTALDVLYEDFDEHFRDGDFERVDKAIAHYSKCIDTYSLDLALGVLTASLPAKSKLPNRGRYLELAISKSIKDGEYTNTLFRGL